MNGYATLTGIQIDNRIESMNPGVFDDIKDDVLWNLKGIMLPGFQGRLLGWNNTLYGTGDLQGYKKSRVLPTHQQWEWLETYLREKDRNLDDIFKLLGFESQEKYVISGAPMMGIGPRTYGRLHIQDSMFPNIESRIKGKPTGHDRLRLLVEE